MLHYNAIQNYSNKLQYVQHELYPNGNSMYVLCISSASLGSVSGWQQVGGVFIAYSCPAHHWVCSPCGWAECGSVMELCRVRHCDRILDTVYVCGGLSVCDNILMLFDTVSGLCMLPRGPVHCQSLWL